MFSGNGMMIRSPSFVSLSLSLNYPLSRGKHTAEKPSSRHTTICGKFRACWEWDGDTHAVNNNSIRCGVIGLPWNERKKKKNHLASGISLLRLSATTRVWKLRKFFIRRMYVLCVPVWLCAHVCLHVFFCVCLFCPPLFFSLLALSPLISIGP